MNKDLFQLVVAVLAVIVLLGAAPYFLLKGLSDRYAKAYAKRIEKFAFWTVRRTAFLAFVRLPVLLLRGLLRLLEWLGCRTRALLTRLLG